MPNIWPIPHVILIHSCFTTHASPGNSIILELLLLVIRKWNHILYHSDHTLNTSVSTTSGKIGIVKIGVGAIAVPCYSDVMWGVHI